VGIEEVRACCDALPPARPPGFIVPGSRAAAVLVPVFEDEGEARVILTKRPETLPSHQGEIAFPGGKAHEGEELRDAALREAEEEIGLAPQAVEVVAQLDGLAMVASRFSVAPFVGIVEGRPALRPHPGEVESVLEVPISELLADGAFHEERWDLWEPDRSVYFFEVSGETIWGATARILVALLTEVVAPQR
jgi:8-oxo-dGTP pyrophosphatase MutT (NUDIX family)